MSLATPRSGTRRFAVTLVAVTLALTAILLGPAAPTDAKRPDNQVAFELTILHNNDGESKLTPSYVPLPGTPSPGPDTTKPFAGVAYFASLVDELRNDALSGVPSVPGARRGVVMLSSGDNYLAGAEWAASLDKGAPYYDSMAMSLVGYDAAAIGNHEFDFGPEVLANFIGGFAPPLTFVSANLDVSGEPTLAALAAAGRIARSTVIMERGELIGIIGATTPQLPNITSPRNVIAGAVAPAVQAQVAALQGMGVNKIILISHLQNIGEDVALARELRGIDVMIAGGGDELLANPWNPLSPADAAATPFGSYPYEPGGQPVLDADGIEVPVITTSGGYKYVGRLVVDFNAAGVVLDVDEARSGPVRVIGFDDGDAATHDYIVSPDPTIQTEVVEPVKHFLGDLATNVLATSQVALDGTRPAIRLRETNLGNLTADSMLWQAQQSAPDFGVDSPQIALQNGGGIRNESLIPAGPITELNTFQILAFTNFVSVMEDVAAEHLKDLLETSISALPGNNGRFGHWAGLSFEYDVTQPGRVINSTTCAVSNEGSRVQTITVGSETIYENGAWNVDPDTWTIDMATNDFTYRGGDCYDFRGKPFTTVGVVYQQALANYLVDGLGGTITSAQYPETPPALPQRIIPQ